jgi:O-antigen/teichoic acid export membrane protein
LGSFANSVSALQWLCLLPVFRSLHLGAGDALTGAGYQRYRNGAQLSAAGLNFGLNLWLIPAAKTGPCRHIKSPQPDHVSRRSSFPTQ